MQCPPTNPGLKFKKFHLLQAASSTALVSIHNLWHIIAISFANAIFTSL